MTSLVNIHSPSVPAPFRFIALGTFITSFALMATPAEAALGSVPLARSATDVTATSLVSGRAFVASRAAAGVSTSSSAASAAYSVNTVTLASGTVVREYVDTSRNQVFGVVWQGPRMPNLRDVLGASYNTFTTPTNDDTGPKFMGLSSRVLRSPSLVVLSQGHLGMFSGKAYLPASLPAGVTASDIQ
jgi:hypothetical protein